MCKPNGIISFNAQFIYLLYIYLLDTFNGNFVLFSAAAKIHYFIWLNVQNKTTSIATRKIYMDKQIFMLAFKLTLPVK